MNKNLENIIFLQVRNPKSSFGSKAKLTRHPSFNDAMKGPPSLRKFASSPKLTIPANATPSHLNQHSHASVYNLGMEFSSLALKN